MDKKTPYFVPNEIAQVTAALKKAGFQAYLVGGCVRDLIIGKKPKDWDVTTNATPEQVIALFPKTFYENAYGTVGVVNEELPAGKDGEPDKTLHIVEVTPYRLEAAYSDHRRPDAVTFSPNLEDDLKRRDFTINAIALDFDASSGAETIIDPYGGREDLKNKLIRAVGKPEDRFTEDALRIMRAVRLSAELGFLIEKETEEAIKKTSHLLQKIAIERIRDEFCRMLLADKPSQGIKMAQKLGILKYIAPELEEGIGIEQNQAHSFDVWTHLLKSLDHAADKDWSLEIRLSALFHDVGKPATRRKSEEKGDWTFYGHEVVGARMTKKILERLKFPKKTTEKVTTMVRWHMFFSDTEKITLSAVRRIVRNVGPENIWDLMNLRICDRVGTGRPKENPYRLRKYKSMIEEALRAPISVAMLKIDGTRMIEILGISPGPKIGHILHALLEETLNDPDLNTAEYLEKRAAEMALLSDAELKKLGEQGRATRESADEEEKGTIRKKYHVE